MNRIPCRCFPVFVALALMVLTDTETQLARRWHTEKKSIPEIAELLGRDQSTINRLFKVRKNAAKSKVGRPRGVTPSVFQDLKKALTSLQKEANAETEVTLAMVKKRAGCTLCERVVADAFHARGIWFRKLREKPILTSDDAKERL